MTELSRVAMITARHVAFRGLTRIGPLVIVKGIPDVRQDDPIFLLRRRSLLNRAASTTKSTASRVSPNQTITTAPFAQAVNHLTHIAQLCEVIVNYGSIEFFLKFLQGI